MARRAVLAKPAADSPDQVVVELGTRGKLVVGEPFFEPGVPIVVDRKGLGEGGSGGAVAIATANKVLMLEHAIYTVASPEASASILWRDSSRAQDAATSMKITAQDLLKFGIIDGVIPEPVGGAHRDPAAAVAATGQAIGEAFKSLQNMSRDELRDARAEKFLAMGRKI